VSTCIKFIITCFLLLTLSACGGGGGETAPQKNISLELPANQTVTEYDSITLTALLTDNGANIKSFNWQQKSGITLNLPTERDGESHAQLTVTAPNVQKDELITLEFKVVHGDTESIKQTTITVKVANDDIADMMFIDDNFASCVRSQAEKQDFKLAREFTSLSCINQNISSAAEIEHFINLTSLTISNNEITPKTKKLGDLATNNQKLKTIDISKLTKLETLDLSYNELTDINLSKQKNLRSLDLTYNLITEIDLSALTSLGILYLDENPINVENIEQLLAWSKTESVIFNLPNQPPTVTFDVLDSAIEYSEVEIWVDVNDIDGFITSFNWLQVSGSEINLPEGESNPLRFTAPSTKEDIVLTFELIVADNKGKTTSKEVSITIKASPYDISAIAYEDESFKKCVLDEANFYDYQLSTDFTALSCPNMEIESVKGLEFFTNLTKLDLHYNQIKNINLTSLTKLTELNISGYRLINLDLTAQVNLISLDITDNPLTNLDLTDQTKLEYLRASNCNLTSIIFPENPQLSVLTLTDNQFTTIDLTTLTELTSLDLSVSSNSDVHFNTIESIDLSGNIKLSSLSLQGQKLPSIDLSTNINLEILDLSVNELRSIDLINQTELKILDLSYNDISNFSLPSDSKLTSLIIRENNLKEIDLTNIHQLEVLKLGSHLLYQIDLSSQTKLKTLEIWESSLAFLNLTNNHELISLTVKESPIRSLFLSVQGSLLSLSLSNNYLNWLDLSQQVNLNSLDLSYTYLTELDLSLHKNLRSLRLSHNQQLTGVNLTESTELRVLDLWTSNTPYPLLEMNLAHLTKLVTLILVGGKIPSIDLSAHTELTRLHLSGNNLTDIDLTNQSKLWELGLNDNLLTTINISNLTELSLLYIEDNPLDDSTKKLLKSLKDVDGLTLFYTP
jgi:Leucine-rich repeat (LRR) protein